MGHVGEGLAKLDQATRSELLQLSLCTVSSRLPCTATSPRQHLAGPQQPHGFRRQAEAGQGPECINKEGGIDRVWGGFEEEGQPGRSGGG